MLGISDPATKRFNVWVGYIVKRTNFKTMGYLTRLINSNQKTLGGYEMIITNGVYSFYKKRKETFYTDKVIKVCFCKVEIKGTILEITTNSGGAFSNYTPLQITGNEEAQILETFKNKSNPLTICWGQL